jgi:NADH pyrophosphatase NudC (nudix superfamily)
MPAIVQNHGVRVAVAQARSVFYAAAEHRLGSRTLRGLRGDDAAARQCLQTLQKAASTLAQAQPDTAEKRRIREAAAAALAARAVAQASQPAAPPRPARYCSVCGTAVLAGARFCQHCGSSLPQA